MMNASSRKKNISTVIILVIVLLVPGFLYVMLNRMGSNSYIVLPVLGEKVLSGEMKRVMGREVLDTIYHQIPSVSLWNDRGDTTLFMGSDSSISVVHLFYTRDDGLSQALLERLRPVVERFQHNQSVKFYSISVDPTDSPEELVNFAKRFNKGLEGSWQFLGDPAVDMLDFSRKHLLMDAMRDTGDSTRFVISPNYALIDSRHRIRGFYDINLKTEMDRLKDEIKVQVVEELRNNPLKIEKK